MKRAALSFSLLLLAAGGRAFGADWHVAPGGADGAAGTEAAPLSTLGHAVSRASSGDRVLLRRGGVYPAQNLDLGSGLQIDAYGSGADPVVTASAAIELSGTWAQNSAVRTAPLTRPRWMRAAPTLAGRSRTPARRPTPTAGQEGTAEPGRGRAPSRRGAAAARQQASAWRRWGCCT